MSKKILMVSLFLISWLNFTNWFGIDKEALDLVKENYIVNEKPLWYWEEYKKVDYVKYIIAREKWKVYRSIIKYEFPKSEKQIMDSNFWEENLYKNIDSTMYFLKNIEKVKLPTFTKIKWTSVYNMIIKESHWVYKILKELITKTHKKFHFYPKDLSNMKYKYYIFYSQINDWNLNWEFLKKELWVFHLTYGFLFTKENQKQFEKKINYCHTYDMWKVKREKALEKSNGKITEEALEWLW